MAVAVCAYENATTTLYKASPRIRDEIPILIHPVGDICIASYFVRIALWRRMMLFAGLSEKIFARRSAISLVDIALDAAIAIPHFHVRRLTDIHSDFRIAHP